MDPRITSYPKEKIKILLVENISPTAVSEFHKAGYSQIEELIPALEEKDLIEKIKDVHILGIRSKSQITKNVIDNANKLIGIGAFCIGTNQIDLDASTSQGIAVFNSPYSNTRSVAELILAFSIVLIRKIPEKNQGAHIGEWLKDASGCYELRGKTLGIIGYGHIGSQVSVLAEALGLRVTYYDIEPKLPLGNAMSLNSLEELLSISDIVTLHVPGNETTKNMLDEIHLKMLKRGSIVLNLARGDVMDLNALRRMIETGHVMGVAVDVFPHEPKGKDEAFVSPLQGLKNVILTPHIGGSTVEAQQNIGLDVATKLVNYLDSGSSVGSVSIPALNLPVQKNTNRILHIHQNVPGVMSEINGTLSRLNVNIMGQFLKTNDQIGYVVLDVEKQENTELLNELKKVKSTLRSRVLY